MLAPYAEKLNWSIFFDNLFQGGNVNFNLSSDPSNLVLTVSEAEAEFICKRFNSAFSSQEAFDHLQPYNIVNKKQIKQSPLKVIAKPADTKEAGIDILLKLIGQQAFEEFGWNINLLFDKTAYSKDRVLYSKVTAHHHVVESWNAAVKYWVSYFENVEASRIQTAWLGGGNLDVPKSDLLTDSQQQEGIVVGLIQQCFRVVTDKKKGSGQICFDFGRLWEYLSVPAIETKKMPNGKVTLSIDKKHLLATLQVYTHNRMLLKVFRGEQSELQGKIFFFGRKPTHEKTMHHTLIIDCSGSTSGFLDQLKPKLMEVIDKLTTLDSTATVRLVFFSTHAKAHEFSITNRYAIHDFIYQTISDGDTRLFGTVVDELEYIRANRINEEYNGTVILFTDGMDAEQTGVVNKRGIGDVYKQIGELNYSSTSLPKMFTVGYGNCDEEVLRSLADLMGNFYVHLNKISEFENIFEHLKTHKAQREMIGFLIQVAQSTREYRFPFYATDKIQSPDVLIPFNQAGQTSIKFQGNEFSITFKDQIPNQTPNDALSGFLARAKEVAIDDDLSIQQKLATIRTILEKVDQVAISYNDKQLLGEIRQEITDLQHKIQIHSNDERAKASFVSMLSAQTGFLTKGTPSSVGKASYTPASHNKP